MIYLKQSTASQSVLIGPFVDDTDGATPETGLTIANTDIRLSANGGNMAAKNSGGGTHDEAGMYTITLDATDTATVGSLQLSVKVAGALYVFHDFQVLEETVYAALFASSAPGYLQPDVAGRQLAVNASGVADANVLSISNDTTAADNLELDYDGTGYDKSNSTIGTCTANTDMVSAAPTASAIATQVWSASGRALSDPAGFKKNTAVSNFAFLMVDSADHVTPITGETVTAERSIDGGAFGSCSNSVSEIASGMYKIDLSASDMNGDFISFKFTSAGADPRYVSLTTET